MAKTRPGVMLYFDTWNAVSWLSDEQVGEFFRAIFTYAQTGEYADFSADPALQMAWNFAFPKVDADGERYKRKSKGSQYAAYKKKAIDAGEIPMEFDLWYALGDTGQEKLLNDFST